MAGTVNYCMKLPVGYVYYVYMEHYTNFKIIFGCYIQDTVSTYLIVYMQTL